MPSFSFPYLELDFVIFLLAITIGTICTAHFGEQLSTVRHTVNAVINNCASGFYTDRWSFLNGADDEFSRVGGNGSCDHHEDKKADIDHYDNNNNNNNSETCLLDIAVSAPLSPSTTTTTGHLSQYQHDIVYILDENALATYRSRPHQQQQQQQHQPHNQQPGTSHTMPSIIVTAEAATPPPSVASFTAARRPPTRPPLPLTLFNAHQSNNAAASTNDGGQGLQGEMSTHYTLPSSSFKTSICKSVSASSAFPNNAHPAPAAHPLTNSCASVVSKVSNANEDFSQSQHTTSTTITSESTRKKLQKSSCMLRSDGGDDNNLSNSSSSSAMNRLLL
jgi:hypothetical protein